MRIAGRIALGLMMLVAVVVAGPPPQPAEASACAIGTPGPQFESQVGYSTGHARVWRLYQAFFLRQPDNGGFEYWLGVRNGGATLSDIAFQFTYADEFQALYGHLSHAEFVDLVYRNVQCREPDAPGRAYWTGLIESGALSRWDMMVNFVEGREYLRSTGTCYSIYPAEAAVVAGCPESFVVPLEQANFATHGYRAFDGNLGSTGSFRGVEVDLTRPMLETGTSRCSVASINGNWLVPQEKDRANPGVLGIGVVDGLHVKGSSDRTDRGVFGLRFDSTPGSVVEVWPGDTLSDDDRRLNSVSYHQNKKTIESWHASAETSPYLREIVPHEIVGANEWVWATAGIPLLIDGQLDSAFNASYHNDPYTYQTLRHSFVAVDQDTNRLVFGATANATTLALVNWATANGYEDLIKFDGGGSAEYNIGGHAVVAGTSRDIPVWIGVGC